METFNLFLPKLAHYAQILLILRIKVSQKSIPFHPMVHCIGPISCQYHALQKNTTLENLADKEIWDVWYKTIYWYHNEWNILEMNSQASKKIVNSCQNWVRCYHYFHLRKEKIKVQECSVSWSSLPKYIELNSKLWLQLQSLYFLPLHPMCMFIYFP